MEILLYVVIFILLVVILVLILRPRKIAVPAIEELESMYIAAIRSGSWFKKRAREENCRRLQVLDDLVTVINNKITEGDRALERLEASNNGSKQRSRIK